MNRQDSRICTWLTENIESIRMEESVAAIYYDLDRWTARINRMVDNREPDTYAGPCDSEDVSFDIRRSVVVARTDKCGADLYCRVGESKVTCGTCGAVYDLAERKEALVAKLNDKLGTTGEIALALTKLMQPVTDREIRRFATNGRLAQRGTMGARELPLYSFGDVVRILHEQSERAAG